MRLSTEQQNAIRQIAVDIIGADARIWLFGSRVDDERKGGDVDLYVEVDRVLPNRVALAVRLAARVERALFGLPVDVILKDARSTAQPIHEIATRTGVRL